MKRNSSYMQPIEFFGWSSDGSYDAPVLNFHLSRALASKQYKNPLVFPVSISS